mgnify:CR=1 FL=1
MFNLSTLRNPFDPRDVQFKPSVISRDGKRALAIAYVEARAVMDRLDEVVGPGNWKDSYRILADRRDGESGQVEVECRLAIRLDDRWVVKADVGSGDDLKAAYSDALKRAGVKWGIGRYLYSLPAVWADYDQTRREFSDPEALRRQVLGNGEEKRPARPQAPNPAAMVSIQTRQGERRLGELTPEQLRWVAENYHDHAVRTAARSLLTAAEEGAA